MAVTHAFTLVFLRSRQVVKTVIIANFVIAKSGERGFRFAETMEQSSRSSTYINDTVFE